MNTPAMMESYGSWMDMDAITASRSSFSDTDATLKTYGGLPPSAFSLSSIASISPSLDPEDYNALGWRAAEPHSSLIRGAIGLDVTQNLATVPGTYDEQTPIGQVTNPFKPYERLQPALAKRNNSMYAEKGFSSFGSSKSRIQERAPKSLPQEPRTPRAAVIPGSREQSAPFGRFDVYAEEEASETAPTRFIISKQAREILQSFLNQRPYPSKEEQEQLARKTNLATCQVKIWFNNNRYRSAKKERNRKKQEKRPGGKLANANFGGLLRDIPKDDSTTIDRFMDSPLEEYPVSWTLIANAAENATYNQQNITLPIFQSRSSSVHSGADSGTSGSSCASVASFSSRTSRKGRRAFAVPVVRSAKPAQNVVKPRRQNIQRFFCTFCPKGFVGRYEWVRHEESVHMPRKMWVCNLQPIISSTPDHPSCQYCAQAEPSDAHMSRHKHEECLQRSREERTFHRYDHLKQHLRLFHGATNITGTTELWSLPGEPLPLMDLALICGFCGFRAGSWEDRCVHLTNHFLEGVDMSRWWLHRRYNEPPSRVVLESDQPVVCPTCEQTFQPFSVYMHTCRVWSCSFLSTPRLAVDIVLDRAVAQEFSVCRYCCSKIWYWPNSGVRPIESLKEEVEHLVVEHRYRSCEQDRFSSVGAFYAHLLTDHGADSPMVEMQDLLDACQGTFCDFELTKAAPI